MTKASGWQPIAPNAQARDIALWPAPLEPWLPRVERQRGRLPPSDPDCPPAVSNLAAPLSIVGVREGDQLRLPTRSKNLLQLKLSALGGSGRRWWFIDGAPMADTANQESFSPTLTSLGRYQLSVLDEAGQTARVEFDVRGLKVLFTTGSARPYLVGADWSTKTIQRTNT